MSILYFNIEIFTKMLNHFTYMKNNLYLQSKCMISRKSSLISYYNIKYYILISKMFS